MIAVLLACLIALGRTALLVSYTHSAVDNVLRKAKKVYAVCQMCQEFLCFHILSKLRDYYIMLLERFDICKQNVLIGEFELTNPRNILRLTRSNLKDEQLKELTLAGQIEKREEDPMGHEFMTKADQDYVKMNEILTTTV